MKSVFFLPSLIFFFLSACVSVPTKAPMNPTIENTQLSNGFSYYLMPHPFPKNRCALRLNVKVGSFHEKDNELGSAHLIEHLAFENRVMGKEKELAVWFQEQGMSFGPDANAFTTIDHTIYHMDLPNCEEKAINDAFTILRSFMDGIEFNDELITKQKAIVDREEESYIDSLSKLNKDITHKLFMGTLFDTRPVLGKKKIRDQITKDQLRNFYQKWYRPDNAQLILIGDFKPDLVKGLINQHFKTISNDSRTALSKISIGKPLFKVPIIIANSSELKAVETVFILQPKNLDIKLPSPTDMRRRLAFELAIAMLSESLTNKSAKQRPDEIEATSIHGFFGLSQEPELSVKIYTNKDNIASVFKRAFSPIKRALDIGFEKAQFERAMNNKIDSIEQAIIREESATSAAWAQAIVDHVNERGLALDAKNSAPIVKGILQKITPNECREALKNAFARSNTYLLSYGQIEENAENKAMLKELLHKVLSEKGKAKSTKTASDLSFRYAIKNSSTPILNKQHFPSIDTYKLSLPNNIEVFLKSTPLQKDVILLRIANQEGLAYMSKRELAIADLVGSTLLSGGLKKQTWQEILKLTRDKTIRIWPEASLKNLSLAASTRQADLRFCLELMRAYLSDPAFNELALAKAKKQLAINHDENQHHIGWPFQSAFPALLSNSDPRAMDIPIEIIEELSQKDLLAWHEKWVAKQPLSITIVGDFDLELMINEVASVFASLNHREPITQKTISPIHYKKGVHKVYEVDTEVQPSKILIRYTLETAKRESPNIVVGLTHTIISEALRLKLREEKRSVYSPQVFLVQHNNGLSPNAIDILLSADKNNAKTLGESAIKQLSKLASSGITTAQFALAKKTFIDNINKQEENIGFWFDLLSNYYSTPDKILRPEAVSKLVEKQSLKEINDYVKKHFSSKNASWAIAHSKEKLP